MSQQGSLGFEILNNGIRVINFAQQTYTSIRFVAFEISRYAGKRMTISAKIKSSSKNEGDIIFGTIDKNGNNPITLGSCGLTTNGEVKKTIRIPSDISETNNYLMIALRGTNNTTAEVNSYVDYTNIMIYEGVEEKVYKPHQSQTKILYTQTPFRALGDIRDVFVKQNGIWYEKHSIFRKIFNGTETVGILTVNDTIKRYMYEVSDINNKTENANKVMAKSNYFKGTTFNERTIDNTVYSSGDGAEKILGINTSEITTTTDFKAKLSELYNAGTPLYIDYVLNTPKLVPCTEQQTLVLNQLENMQLYGGENYIYTINVVDSLLTINAYNAMEEYEIYVSGEGYLILPGINTKFLINLSESVLPGMPEATESSVRAAGRDGDIVLSTTYEPLTSEIVCYTEDNLSIAEKKQIENQVKIFLNSIKNKTKKIAFEKDEKYYNMKYSGFLNIVNYPAHLKFSIPLKSSDSFGKDIFEKVIGGNNSIESNTVESVGALFTIKGPATLPIISFNDYSMEYSTSILEGARIEIDTNKSTVTHINSAGVKTNVMKYYNHQFPKVENGQNVLKVLSGVDNEYNVTVKWNDLKL